MDPASSPLIFFPSIPADRLSTLRNDYKSQVLIYSKTIFPLQFLWEDTPKSDDSDLAFEIISLKCSAVRKCAAGDQHALWTVFTIGYIEHLTRLSTDISELLRLIGIVQSTLPQTSATALCQELENLQRIKEAGISGVAWMISNSGNRNFWFSIREFFKLFSRNCVRSNPDEFEMFRNMDPDTAQVSFLDGDDTQIPITVLAKVFNLQIVVYTPEDISMVKEKYAPDVENVTVAKLFLFKNRNVYHTLYSPEQLDAENYDITSSSPYPEPRAPMFASKLFTVTKKKRVIPSKLGLDLEADQNSISRLASFCIPAQDFVKIIFDLLRRDGTTDFFDNSMIKSNLLMMREFSQTWRNLMQFKEQRAEEYEKYVIAAMERIQPLQEVFHNELIFRETGTCESCQKQKGEVSLKCAHNFCQECIMRAMQQKIDKNHLFLKPNGETVDEFVCPIIGCFVRIPGEKVQEILGTDYFSEYKCYVENFIQKKQCDGCKRIRGYESFKVICQCNSVYCLNCYCDFIRRNEKYCYCKQIIQDEMLNYLQTLTKMCVGCLGQKSLINDFSNVECDEHSMCQDCLELALKENGRCSQCYRKFTDKELNEIRYMQDKLCACCNKECRRARLNTSCGCIMCMSCAIDLTREKKKCTNCFICASLLPEQAYNQLIVLITEPGNVQPREFQCWICWKVIEEQDLSRPNCDHMFHRHCFEEYLEEKLRSGYSQSTLPCPEKGCEFQIPSSDLKKLVGPEIYEKYLRIFKTPCPRCPALCDSEENGMLKNSILCTNCAYHFCVVCNEQYEQNHDKKKCEYLHIQEFIRLIEQTIGPKEMVTQCPGCKHPLIYSAACQNVKCTPGCGMQFCVNCSTPAYLFAIHGNAWHRPECRFYDKNDRREGASKTCRQCELKGGICDPPKKLKVPRKFDINEI